MNQGVSKLWPLLTASAVVAAVALVFTLYASESNSQEPAPPLASLAAEKGKNVGVYIEQEKLEEPRYSDIAAAQFDLIVVDQPDWHSSAGAQPSQKDTYDFSKADEVVSFASQNHKSVQMQHLVWGEEKSLPDWLKNGNYSSEELLKIMQDHITTVVGHYKDQVREWSVVNEAFSRSSRENGQKDWWNDHIATDYIDQAFAWARGADPKAVLILSDRGIEVQNKVSDAVYEKVKAMKATGVPIDAVGMKLHIDGSNPPNPEEVKKNIKRFGELGVNVFVTEFDVNMNNFQGSNAEKLARQSRIYYEVARACVESDYCPSFSVHGFTDAESSPVLFDAGYKAGPAFYSLREAFSRP